MTMLSPILPISMAILQSIPTGKAHGCVKGQTPGSKHRSKQHLDRGKYLNVPGLIHFIRSRVATAEREDKPSDKSNQKKELQSIAECPEKDGDMQQTRRWCVNDVETDTATC